MERKNLKTSLKVIHWNCNSLNNKKELLESFLQKHQPDVLLLNETKLDSLRAYFFLTFKGYTSIHKCRNSRGGGVAILIKNSIEFLQINDLDFFNCELIAIRLTIMIGSIRKYLHI